MKQITDALIQKHWDDWFDYSCVCGFPHPKAGKFGPPPEVIDVDGELYNIGPYTGVMGGDHPVNES